MTTETQIMPFQPQEMTFLDMPQVILPRIRIDKSTGEFTHDYGDKATEIQAAIVMAHNFSRVLWPEKFRVGNQPLCKSDNSLWPVERDPNANEFGTLDESGLRTCTGCPLAEWSDLNGESIKPRCALVINLLLVDLDTEMPGVLSLARTRFKVAQNLSSFWAMTNFRFSVALKTFQHTAATGTWYMVEFARGPKFSPEQREGLAALYAQVRGWQLAAVASELQQADTEENGSAAGPRVKDAAEMLHGEREEGID